MVRDREDLRGVRGGDDDFDDGDDGDDAIDAEDDSDKDDVRCRDYVYGVNIERVGGGVPSFVSISCW